MPVQILFVIPMQCNSENECSPLMREAYEAVVSGRTNCKWIKELGTELNTIQTTKTDFIIFEEFDGELYKQVLHSKSVRILSPLCLLQCITQGKPIPNSETPLVSLAMENCLVVCSCLPKESKRALKFKVQAMGGLFSFQLVVNTTHLITNGVKSDKYNEAAKMGIKIMRPEFIDALWGASNNKITHASEEEYQSYKCPVFLNLNFSITGFAKHETDVPNMIVKHGGKYTATMDIHKTDILICKSSNSTSSAKYKSAIKHKIDCMTADWIIDSIEKGYALPNVKDYSVKAATSTPTKQNKFVDPNFSQMSMIVKPTSSQPPESMTPQVIEETVNQSCVFADDTPITHKAHLIEDQIIDDIDIKRVKACGPFLDGYVIYIAGFKNEQKEKLCKILNFTGAVSCFTLNDRITHAIIGNLNCHEFEQISSRNLPCALVNINWLLDSMNQQIAVDVDKYLINTNNTSKQSPTAETGSPLCKKGLTFLRAAVSVTNTNVTNSTPPIVDQVGDQDDQMLTHYLNSMQRSNSVDDALAAFTLNQVHNEKRDFINRSHNTNDGLSVDRTSPSISITVEETMLSVFSNLNFVVANYTEEEEEYIIAQIKELQGVVVGQDFKGVPDYAIVPINSEQSQLTAVNFVTYLWIAECAEEKRLITELEYYHLPFPTTSNVLQGLCISLSGFSKLEKDFLSHVIAQLGGVEQDRMARRAIQSDNTLATTHLITNDLTGKKYQGALKWGLPVLGKDWLFKCAEVGRRVAEEEFFVENRNGRSKVEAIADGNLFQTPGKRKQNIEIASTTKTDTPNQKIPVNNVDGCQTPPNVVFAPCSQITPVNEIMARVRKMCDGLDSQGGPESPSTPLDARMNDSIDTPDTPYGAVFQNPPPPEVRKKWKRWLDTFPSPKRAPDTPLSEIKRRFWANFNAIGGSGIPVRELRREFPSPRGVENQIPLEDENVPMVVEDICTGADVHAMNDSVIAQFNELESHMMSSGGSARRQSTRKIEKEGGVVLDRESQPMSVGWDDNMMIPIVASAKPKNFMISGVDMDERASLVEKLENLGATVSALSNFDPASTHLLCEKLNRNEKLLASMASGLWIVHISYALDSAEAGMLLNEEDYEFGNLKASHKFKLDNDNLQRASAAKYWREEIGRRGYGAFHDVRAIVVANKKGPMIRVLEAGGAVILDISPPFGDSISATHCFLEVKNNDLTPYTHLAEQGILCINTLYVNDFLQRTVQDINDFIIPGFQKYY